MKIKIPKKQYEELREFKKRAGIEMYNARQLYENEKQPGVVPCNEFKIGNTNFKLYGDGMNRDDIDEMLRRFKTTTW